MRTRTAILALALTVSAVASAGQDDKRDGAGIRRSIALTEEARRSIIARVVAHPAVVDRAPGHRLVGIRATAGTVGLAGAARTVLTVVIFDHTALETRRVAIDAVTDEVISDDILPGHPQRSPEEVDEATSIVRRDAALARLLDGGAVLDGGFIVDDPAGSRRRMIQFKLITADRRTLLRTVTVDLTRRRIAAVTASTPSQRAQ